MKRITHRPLAACLALTALLALPACGLTSHTPPAGNLPNTSDVLPEASSPETASPESLSAYYESLIAELREAILRMKETDYITRAEYESRIHALEDELASLKSPDVGADLPVWNTPADTATAPESESGDPTRPSAAMAFRYGITDGAAVILQYLGDETKVTVPAAIDGYPVTSIADEAFRGTAVTSVILPYSVTRIGWFAFADCTSLKSVTLPASVESIDYGAFDSCPDLTLCCPPDSYAAQYAVSFGMKHEYT